MKHISYVALVSLVVLSACKNSFGDIPTSAPVGIVTFPTGDAFGGVHTMSPSAYFIDAVNVTIPNSHIINDQCQQLPYPGVATITQLSQIAAGSQVTVRTTLDTANLLPQPADANGYVFYKLAVNDSMLIHPGLTAHITIPGADPGFSAFDFDVPTADSLFVQPLTVDVHDTDALPLSWNQQTPGTTQFVIELEFNGNGGGSPNTQIFCSFNDDGQDTVPATLANLWRAGSAQKIHAYRWMTTTVGSPVGDSDAVVVISQYTTDSTQMIFP
jgi:hypothetical protein